MKGSKWGDTAQTGGRPQGIALTKNESNLHEPQLFTPV